MDPLNAIRLAELATMLTFHVDELARQAGHEDLAPEDARALLRARDRLRETCAGLEAVALRNAPPGALDPH